MLLYYLKKFDMELRIAKLSKIKKKMIQFEKLRYYMVVAPKPEP